MAPHSGMRSQLLLWVWLSACGNWLNQPVCDVRFCDQTDMLWRPYVPVVSINGCDFVCSVCLVWNRQLAEHECLLFGVLRVRWHKCYFHGDGMSCGCNLLEAAKAMTGCVCSGPGFCERHKCRKNNHLFSLCHDDPRYFEMWENSAFPCPDNVKPVPKTIRFGLGDLVAVVVRIATFGFVKPWPGCGCDKRKAWLNRVVLWGWWR